MRDVPREPGCWFAQTVLPGVVLAIDMICPVCKVAWPAGDTAGSIAKTCHMHKATNALLRSKGWRP